MQSRVRGVVGDQTLENGFVARDALLAFSLVFIHASRSEAWPSDRGVDNTNNSFLFSIFPTREGSAVNASKSIAAKQSLLCYFYA